MTACRITYNVHAQRLLDKMTFMEHIERLQPTALFIMDGLGLAREVKAALPETMVIHRNWGVTQGDDAVFAKVSPQQWLDLRAGEAAGGIVEDPGSQDPSGAQRHRPSAVRANTRSLGRR